MVRWVVPAAVVVVGLVVVGWAVVTAAGYERYRETADSMAPTMTRGDSIKVLEIEGDQVRRGDIIVFAMGAWPDDEPADGEQLLIKRVIAVGGDAVAGGGGGLTVNGKRVVEDYLFDEDPSMARPFDAQVPAGTVFVAGDYRSLSRDSRIYASQGAIPFSHVKGVVVEVDGKPVVPTKAFTAAGLAGEPTVDRADRSGWLAVGTGVSLVGAIWLVVGLVWRKRPKASVQEA
ncbi:signal peptidase I [Actinokineospora baliensis]|uniref:signal peptidase I n=1 Tax=Actinokineospora baliensis TaxID=547056 RepID=UPI0019595B09|nr:signal peptidase I [Actinokineospora baliensis]MBM7771290.1 signal peptidase I [Actinokineospora baliensis]